MLVIEVYISHFFDSHPISRSRKRSCQACTSLKVKCDLRQPCSKCLARGRDCVYATEEGQRDCVVGPSNSSQQGSSSRLPAPLVRLDASAGFDCSVLGRGGADAFANTFPELTLIEETCNMISSYPLSDANLASFVEGAPRISQSSMSLPTIDANSDVTSSSYCMGPKHAFTTFGASDVAGHSRGLQGFSSTMFEPFFRDVYSVKEEPSQENVQGTAPLLHAPDAGTLVDGLGQPDFTQSFSLDANPNRVLVSDLMTNVYYDNRQAPHLMHEPSQASVPVLSSLPASQSTLPPNPQPMYPSNPTYAPSKPPMYIRTQQEPFLSHLCPVNVSTPDPSAEELQHYRGSLTYASSEYVKPYHSAVQSSSS